LHTVPISLLAMLALAQGVAGLYRLTDYRVVREAALSGASWAIAFAPPTWFRLILIALLAALALLLVWRMSQSAGARLLALFSALVASGYGVMVTVSSSPLFAGYMQVVGVLRRWGVERELLRGGLHLVEGLERLLLIGAWGLAGTVSILFVRRVLEIGAAPESDRVAEAAFVVMSFACIATGLIATGLPSSAVVLSTAAVLASLGLVGWWSARRAGSPRSPWVLAMAAAFALYVPLSPPSTSASLTGNLVLAAFLMMPAAWRVAQTRPKLLIVLPGLLALVAALSRDMVRASLLVMLLWIGVCMVMVLATIVHHIRALSRGGQRQALWFLSGWVMASIAAFLWGGRRAGRENRRLHPRKRVGGLRAVSRPGLALERATADSARVLRDGTALSRADRCRAALSPYRRLWIDAPSHPVRARGGRSVARKFRAPGFALGDATSGRRGCHGGGLLSRKARL